MVERERCGKHAAQECLHSWPRRPPLQQLGVPAEPLLLLRQQGFFFVVPSPAVGARHRCKLLAALPFFLPVLVLCKPWAKTRCSEAKSPPQPLVLFLLLLLLLLLLLPLLLLLRSSLVLADLAAFRQGLGLQVVLGAAVCALSPLPIQVLLLLLLPEPPAGRWHWRSRHAKGLALALARLILLLLVVWWALLGGCVGARAVRLLLPPPGAPPGCCAAAPVSLAKLAQLLQPLDKRSGDGQQAAHCHNDSDGVSEKRLLAGAGQSTVTEDRSAFEVVRDGLDHALARLSSGQLTTLCSASATQDIGA
jgi:hypothetical protein